MAAFRYEVTVEAVEGTGGRVAQGGPLQFEVGNHDDLFTIAHSIRERAIVDPGESAALAIGLKLFMEVLLKKQADPLFAPLLPPLRTFIEQLKAVPAQP